MTRETFVAVTFVFANISLLPRIFFRTDGRLNLRWWLTASPLFTSAGFVIAGYAGIVRPLHGGLRPAMSAVAVVLSMASVALIWFTLGTHRIPLSLWHQDNDAPRQIVTWGAYRRIRHPFYAAFILVLAAAALSAPGLGTAVPLVVGVVALSLTARREERRLLASDFGDDYRRYLATTHRFVPALRRAP